MIVDHIAAVFLPVTSLSYLISRLIGRLVMPIFVIYLVHGYFHTRSYLKYWSRVFWFGVFSQPIYMLTFGYSMGVNIFLELSILLALIDSLANKRYGYTFLIFQMLFWISYFELGYGVILLVPALLSYFFILVLRHFSVRTTAIYWAALPSWFFYVGYPLHLLAIWGASWVLNV